MVGGDPERGVFGLDCWFPDSDFDCDDFERGQGLELVSFSRCAGLAGKKKFFADFYSFCKQKFSRRESDG